MKDRYGYETICQKNYAVKHQKNVEIKMRRVALDEGNPEVQIGIQIRTLKGNNGNEKLYTEYGEITLKGEELAEIAKLFKS